MNWKAIFNAPGNPRSLFWSIFRVAYFVDIIIGVAFFLVWKFPPKDGDVVHALIGCVLLNTCYIALFWALIPERFWYGEKAKTT